METWDEFIENEKGKSYFEFLDDYLEKCEAVIYPDKERVFAAFDHTPLDRVKVVILGDEPYSNGLANGFAWGVDEFDNIPFPLERILSESGQVDLGMGNLTHWAYQGVLLLNQVLTVEAYKPNSHENIGWETFTENAIRLLNVQHRNLVFLAMGEKAQKLLDGIDLHISHKIVRTSSPQLGEHNKGFMGSGAFEKINELLVQSGQSEIHWELSDLNYFI